MERGEGLITPKVAIGDAQPKDAHGGAGDVASVLQDHQVGLLRVAYLLCGDDEVAQGLSTRQRAVVVLREPTSEGQRSWPQNVAHSC